MIRLLSISSSVCIFLAQLDYSGVSAQADVPTPSAKASDEIDLNRIGYALYCEIDEKEYVNLYNVREYKNKTIILDSSVDEEMVSRKVEIDGEALIFHETSGAQKRVEIDTLIDRKENLDVELSFVEIDKKEFLLWKETYLHQQYRFGLFSMDDFILTKYCQGVGSHQSSWLHHER